MAANTRVSKDTFSDEQFLKVANHAVANAIEKHRRLGESIVVMRDGKITWLAPEEIPPLEDLEPRMNTNEHE